jgi:C-terminal processing protease CtpA/Prc
MSLEMLEQVKNDIRKYYYDGNFRGIDLEENHKKTQELIRNASSFNEMMGYITRFCYLFEDSHLGFSPPRKRLKVDYGLNLLSIDGKAFVTDIKTDADAFQKGVRVGDQVYSIEGFILGSRQELNLLTRHYFVLQPQTSLNLLIVKPNGNKYKLDVKPKVEENARILLDMREEQLAEQNREDLYAPDHFDKIPGLSIIKMPSFELSEYRLDRMMDKPRETDALILDLRGNRGGRHDSLGRMIGYFFDRQIEGGTLIERGGRKIWSIKPSAKNRFKGKLVVLIDSNSSSASEIFARIIQLEKRGTVIGDQSAGAVMQSIFLTHAYETGAYVFYGVGITTADFIMKDGQRLEKTGVTPDEKQFPTPPDLANGRDPVLSRAAETLGFKLTPEEAGTIFKEEKKK